MILNHLTAYSLLLGLAALAINIWYVFVRRGMSFARADYFAATSEPERDSAFNSFIRSRKLEWGIWIAQAAFFVCGRLMIAFGKLPPTVYFLTWIALLSGMVISLYISVTFNRRDRRLLASNGQA